MPSRSHLLPSQNDGRHGPRDLPVPADVALQHELEVGGEAADAVDPHDGRHLEDGHPQHAHAAAVSVHQVDDVLEKGHMGRYSTM